MPKPDKRSADYLAIAIDATFSLNINKKANRIKREIKSGKLAKIKYFRSKLLGFRGEKAGIPKFIIGLDKGHLEKLTKTWINHNIKELSQHPLQIILFDEIMLQVEYFKKYAQKVGQTEIAAKYNDIYNIFQRVRVEKQSDWDEILKDEKNKEIMKTDRVYKAIKDLVADLSDE